MSSLRMGWREYASRTTVRSWKIQGKFLVKETDRYILFNFYIISFFKSSIACAIYICVCINIYIYRYVY